MPLGSHEACGGSNPSGGLFLRRGSFHARRSVLELIVSSRVWIRWRTTVLVSVIIPTLDRPKLLLRAMDIVLR
jgi:hypothetical protein